jgi:hypothetical protein
VNVTHHRNTPRALLPLVALALVLGCALPTTVLRTPATSQPIATPEDTHTPAPTRTPLPTRTARPPAGTPANTATRVPSLTPRPTRTAAPTAVSLLPGAALTLADFPDGFLQLDQRELALLGMSQEQIERQLGSSFIAAQPVNFTAFMNNDLVTYQLVFAVLYDPLSTSEQAGLDLGFDKPEEMLKAFALGFDSSKTTPPEIIPGSDVLGDKSLGVTASMTEGTFPLRLELILTRRGEVAEMLISLSRTGNPPTADALGLATTLDERVAQALSK